jgi:hypothetical protein
VLLHDGVQTPATHCSLFGHCVASEHSFAGATQLPSKHFAPAPSDVQAESLVHPENELLSPDELSDTHDTAPLSSLQTKPVGQPELEQSPG